MNAIPLPQIGSRVKTRRRKARQRKTRQDDAWYKRYPRDFHDGTRELSLEARGAYSDVVDLIYLTGAPLSDNAPSIAHKLAISTRKWLHLREVLINAGKLYITEDGCLGNERADEELAERLTRRQLRVKSAPTPRQRGAKPPRKIVVVEKKPFEIKGRLPKKPTEPEAEPDSDTDAKKKEPASYDAASLRADDVFISDLTKWHPTGEQVEARLWLNQHIEQFGEGAIRSALKQLRLDFAQGKVKQRERPLGLFSSIIERKSREGRTPDNKHVSRKEKFAAMRRANGGSA